MALSVHRPAKRLRGKTPPPVAPQVPLAAPPQLDPERAQARQLVYLVTASHPRAQRSTCGVLLRAPNTYSREWLRDAFLDAAARPVYGDVGNRARHAAGSVRPAKMSVFKEFHLADAAGVVNSHYHVAIKAEQKFMFMPIKRALLQKYGVATHWSPSHTEYWSAVRYCFWPTPNKPEGALDRHYLLWCADGDHEPLFEAAQQPATAKALAGRRQSRVLSAAQDGQREPRPTEIDVWPLIVLHNIRNTDDNQEAHLQLIAKAKEACTPAMLSFLFRIRRRLPGLIDDVWQWEEANDRVELSAKTRMTASHDAIKTPCRCYGEWWPCIQSALGVNGISAPHLAHDLFLNFEHGRSETVPVVVLAGLQGGEGKSLLLAPITAVLGDQYVLQGLATGAFPMMDLPSKKAVILNEWRFTSAPVTLGIQLLWFEGKAVPITRPQNDREVGSGHCLYTGTAPVFITAPLESLQPLINQAEDDKRRGRASQLTMLMRRLHVYYFTRPCVPPRRQLQPCPACFARFVLGGEAAWRQQQA